MRKTIKILRMEDAKEDYSWALAFSDEEKVNLATRLLHDLWQASQPQPFPRMDRQKVVYTQGRGSLALRVPACPQDPEVKFHPPNN